MRSFLVTSILMFGSMVDAMSEPLAMFVSANTSGFCSNSLETLRSMNGRAMEIFSSEVHEKSEQNSDNVRRHGIYFEPMLFGRIGSLGYSYDFLRSDQWFLTASGGFGMIFKFYNPQTAFLFPVGLDIRYKIKKRFFIAAGIYDYIYINYWENFTEEGINCTGLWICPPKSDLTMLLPYVGCSWYSGRFEFSPKCALIASGWWTHPAPFPSMIVKLKF